MNKQKLATTIWSMATSMRSKIEASEYKDLVLGLIFYKFLSSKEEDWLKANDWSEDDIKELALDTDGNVPEDLLDDYEDIQKALGYFISYSDLFSSWLASGKNLEFKDVIDALSRFNRFISAEHARLYSGIFDSLSIALPKLGDSDAARGKAVRELLSIVNLVPTDGKQGYDVLGFVYEYLLKRFAYDSKKGEFYTPAAVSQLMADIIADHLKDADEIKIFDGAAGSSSLLLSIGGAVARRNGAPEKIRYYAQEYKEATYNLTRMNLVMHGIEPGNIVTRRGDTLDPNDWPVVGQDDCNDGLPPLLVNACAENPPYSQAWDTREREDDPRFKEYGTAPKSKADYAFLLHALYHLQSDGIMTIILPHGVLFRGDAEGDIRRQLVERDQIDTIIGLPANIFYNTPIATLVMVLRKQRERSDILFIDASKGFVKAGKKNELRASDIKRAYDAYKAREDIPGYAHLATKEEIRENDYNLNIPRYVDSVEPVEPIDIYASMFGGVPASEVDELSKHWSALPGLREALFIGEGDYLEPVKGNLAEIVRDHQSTIAFTESYTRSFTGFGEGLYSRLVAGYSEVNPAADEETVADDVFSRMRKNLLVDPYDGYQVLDDMWKIIAADVETLQSEGFDAVRKVDPNIVTKKNKEGREEQVQDGYVGRIVPFELVQSLYLSEQLADLRAAESHLSKIAGRLAELSVELPEEATGQPYVKEDGGFAAVELAAAIAELVAAEEDPAIEALVGYLALLEEKAPKNKKLDYIAAHPEAPWACIESNKDGTYGKTKITACINELQMAYQFDKESLGAFLVEVLNLITKEKAVKKSIREQRKQLDVDAHAFIENMDDDQARVLLNAKWIEPLLDSLMAIPAAVIDALVAKVEHLADKYAVTYSQVGHEIFKTEKELAGMVGQLSGGEYDMAGLGEFKILLGGE